MATTNQQLTPRIQFQLNIILQNHRIFAKSYKIKTLIRIKQEPIKRSKIYTKQKGKKSILKGIRWPNNRNTPFKQIILVNQSSWEPINRVLAKICKKRELCQQSFTKLIIKHPNWKTQFKKSTNQSKKSVKIKQKQRSIEIELGFYLWVAFEAEVKLEKAKPWEEREKQENPSKIWR